MRLRHDTAILHSSFAERLTSNPRSLYPIFLLQSPLPSSIYHLFGWHLEYTVREDLEAMKAKLRIQVVELATIADDVTPGALQATKAVKTALSDRIR